MRVKYEDLVEQPAAILKKICRFLEFNYEDAMSEGGNFIPMFTATEQHKLVGKPPSSKRIHAWRTELSQRQIELFEVVASGMLFYLGYEPSIGLQSRPRTPVQRFLGNIRELFIGSFERKINTYLRKNPNGLVSLFIFTLKPMIP